MLKSLKYAKQFSFFFFIVAAGVRFDDVLNADEGSCKHCDEGENHQEKIFPQKPFASTEAAVGRQEDDFDEGGHEQAQTAEENGTDQADKRFKIWNSNRECSHYDHNAASDGNFRNISSFSDSVFDFLEQDFHGNVELQAEGEENCETDENLSSDCCRLICRQVQRDGSTNSISKSYIS